MERRVKITYEGGNGTFEYVSNQPDLYVAIAVATKEMFKQCIWLSAQECRITDVQVSHVEPGQEDRETEGHYEGGAI